MVLEVGLNFFGFFIWFSVFVLSVCAYAQTCLSWKEEEGGREEKGRKGKKRRKEKEKRKGEKEKTKRKGENII